MSSKSNSFKNTSKEESEFPILEEPKPKRERKKEVPVAEKKPAAPKFNFEFIQKIKEFVANEKTQKIVGAFSLLFSVYLLFAFVSFLFTWQQDQDKLFDSWYRVIGNSEMHVDNWLGRTGAVIANQFIHRWFGVASFLFVPLLFIIGLKTMLKVSIFSIKSAIKNLLFFLIWVSVTMGFIFNDKFFFLGGSFGYHTNIWLQGFVGSIGAGLAIGFSLLTYIIVVFNPSFQIKRDPKAAIIPEGEEVPDVTENVYKGKVEEIDPIKKEVELEFDEPFLKKNDDPVVVDEEIVPPVVTDEFEEVTPVAEEKKTNEPTFEINEPVALQEPEDIANAVQNKIEADRLANLKPENLPDYDPKLDLSEYKFPHVEMLNPYGGDKSIEINKEELEENKNRIVKTLSDYGITISKIKASVGPTVTLYEIIPDAGVRISKIKNLEDDIALSLAALGIRIIAPMPGKGTIGIEVPNSKPDIVPMRYILDSDKFRNSTFELPIALGKTILNEVFIADLAKMPHLLMAGATGQGKSVGLNAILASLLYKKHPSELKFVLVDPKKVELTLFNKIERHFLAKLPGSEEAIITDTKKVIHTLNSLCIEMDNRYELLKHAQVRNLKEYNAKFISRRLLPTEGHRFLPYIVLVVDEFADLIMTAGKEVETPIARLAQLARAIGIHLIIATQRPSVNIITGTIKANFPARIAFRVTSKIDSRTILDAGGAEQLIGRGDMLLSTGNDLTRIQCAFIDTPEVEEVCEFIGNQRAYPQAYELPEYIDENGDGNKKEALDPSERDEFFEEAARLIIQTQQGSTSLIQRKMKLGYNRAGRIMDQLEAAGVVGAFEGSKARQVLIKTEADLEQFLKGNL